jgi:hypothetical protein
MADFLDGHENLGNYRLIDIFFDPFKFFLSVAFKGIARFQVSESRGNLHK